jgi:hypothetical protein
MCETGKHGVILVLPQVVLRVAHQDVDLGRL